MKTEHIAAEVVAALREKGLLLATAESCTGGGVGKALTSVSGSSSVFLGGVIAYANAVKETLLGVPAETLQSFGAVSHQTAEAMAVGVKALLKSDVAVSITGIAGPASDDTQKPVGLVYIATATDEGINVQENRFDGDREAVRTQSIVKALQMVLSCI